MFREPKNSFARACRVAELADPSGPQIGGAVSSMGDGRPGATDHDCDHPQAGSLSLFGSDLLQQPDDGGSPLLKRPAPAPIQVLPPLVLG